MLLLLLRLHWTVYSMPHLNFGTDTFDHLCEVVRLQVAQIVRDCQMWINFYLILARTHSTIYAKSLTLQVRQIAREETALILSFFFPGHTRRIQLSTILPVRIYYHTVVIVFKRDSTHELRNCVRDSLITTVQQ